MEEKKEAEEFQAKLSEAIEALKALKIPLCIIGVSPHTIPKQEEKEEKK